MISEELKEYLNHRKDGYFELTTKEDATTFFVTPQVRLHQLENDGKYFVKNIDKGKNSYSMVSAEVLLSRLYPKLGLKSVEYLPIYNKGVTGVISKDISSKNITDVVGFLFDVVDGTRECLSNMFLDYSDVVYFSDEYNRGKVNTITNFLKYVDVEYFKQLFTLRAVDLATFNHDRHLDNFRIEKNEKGIAQNIILLDSEACGCPIYRIDSFYSDFTPKNLRGAELVKAFKENEDYQQYISRFEIAEKIATAPFDETAREIKEDFGFIVDGNFLEEVKANSYKVAEDLAQ